MILFILSFSYNIFSLSFFLNVAFRIEDSIEESIDK